MVVFSLDFLYFLDLDSDPNTIAALGVSTRPEPIILSVGDGLKVCPLDLVGSDAGLAQTRSDPTRGQA